MLFCYMNMNAFLKRAVLILVLLLSGYINTGYGEKVCIKKVIDGDTIILKSGKRVRFIGIDAPEKYDGNKMVRNSRAWKLDKERIKELGGLSYDYLLSLFKTAGALKDVFLKYDKNNVFSGHKDKFGRKLAYVFIPFKDDGKEHAEYVFDTIGGKKYLFLNATMIKAGYAFVYMFAKFEYKDNFILYEEKARKEKKGLWGKKEGFLHIWEHTPKQNFM